MATPNTTNYTKLVNKLRELFELDKADLDFGIYRIISQRQDEIDDFLQNRLKQTVSGLLSSEQGSQQEDPQRMESEVYEHLYRFFSRYYEEGDFISQRRVSPKHPQTNGMVERFNGRISQVVKTTHFANIEEMQTTLNQYMKTYNHHIVQRNLDHLTPIQAMKKWYREKPELFNKRVYEQTGLDIRNSI